MLLLAGLPGGDPIDVFSENDDVLDADGEHEIFRQQVATAIDDANQDAKETGRLAPPVSVL